MSSSLRSFYLLHNNCQIPLDLESVDAGESADEDIGVMTCWLKNSAKVRLMNDGVAFLSESAECGKMSALLALRQSPSQIRSLSDQRGSFITQSYRLQSVFVKTCHSSNYYYDHELMIALA